MAATARARRPSSPPTGFALLHRPKRCILTRGKTGHRAMSVYTYVVTHDAGLAPNPFWGWCTVAVCTPNHQGSKVKPGDWIAGFLDKPHGHKFLYAMEVFCDRIHMDAYFRDETFAEKKPRVRGSWMRRCGDNFYYLDKVGMWQQHKTLFHRRPGDIAKDTKHPWVFVAKKFLYLGREARPLPGRLKALVPRGRGVRVNRPSALDDQFKTWVQENFQEGVTALPRDIGQCGCGPNPSFQRTAKGCAVVCR